MACRATDSVMCVHITYVLCFQCDCEREFHFYVNCFALNVALAYSWSSLWF